MSTSSLLPQVDTSPIEDFFCLYKRCVTSELIARIAIHNATGNQEITLSCRLQSPSIIIATPVARRRHCIMTVTDEASAVAMSVPSLTVPSAPPCPRGKLTSPRPEPSLFEPPVSEPSLPEPSTCRQSPCYQVLRRSPRHRLLSV